MKIGFLNDNRNRAYPFVRGSVGSVTASAGLIESLPKDIIVDAGFMPGVLAGFDPLRHRIWLESIQNLDGLYRFTFASDAPALYRQTMVFTRDPSDPIYSVEHAETRETPFLSEVSEPAPPTDTLCIQLGSSGTFTAAFSGQLWLYFNDDNYGDNAGEYELTIDGVPYTIPSLDRGGIPGPHVVRGQTCTYSCTGIIRWKIVPFRTSTPDGPIQQPYQIANDRCPCPSLRKWSCVAKLFYSGGDSDTSATADDCPAEPLWAGFLVTGSLAKLAQLIPDEGDIITRSTNNGGIIEPALIQNLAGTFVASINLANQDRTRTASPADCAELLWPYPTGEEVVHVNATCLQGHVRISAGYNTVIRQETFDSAIIIGAAVGAGAGESCEEVKLFNGEIPPNNSTLLGGGPSCHEVVRSINGAGGRQLFVRSGLGVKVTSDPAGHEIVIAADMSQLAICYNTQVSDVSESV